MRHNVCLSSHVETLHCWELKACPKCKWAAVALWRNLLAAASQLTQAETHDALWNLWLSKY